MESYCSAGLSYSSVEKTLHKSDLSQRGFRHEMFKSNQLVLRNPDARGVLEHDICKCFNFKDVCKI